MSIDLGKEGKKYTFEGPHKVRIKDGSYQYDLAVLEDKSGVYAIFERRLRNGKYVYGVLDIGESAKVHNRVANHDRCDDWEKNCANDELYVGVHYTPNKEQAGRKEVEQELRGVYNPCCGDR